VIVLAFFLLSLLSPQTDSPVPLDAGTWWEYRELAREKTGSLWSATELTTRFEVRGTSRGLFVRQTGGADPAPGPVELGERWIRLTPWTGEEALPVPLAVGAVGPGAADGLAGWRVEEEETISVPAGDFRAFRCVLRTPSLDSVLWITPGVGVVRETQGRPEEPPDIERELVRWSGTASGLDSRSTP
jgi:hypothetical protein